jgi:hypothetical protein
MEKISYSPIELSNSTEQYHSEVISKDDLLIQASKQFESKIGHNFSTEQLEAFIKDRVHGIKTGNCNIILIEQEHSGQPLSPIVQAYCASPNTKVNVVEYFWDEISQNISNVPIIGKKLKNLLERPKHKNKFNSTNQIVEISKASGKPIVAADPANGIEYMLEYAGIAPLLTAAMLQEKSKPLRVLSAIGLGMWGFNRYHEHNIKITRKLGINSPVNSGGIFDQTTVHHYEPFLLDLEDSRRLVVSEAIRQLAKEYPETQYSEGQIVVIYPKAHILRIKEYILGENPLTRKTSTIKRYLYSANPLLDISSRTYKWTKHGWTRFSERSTSICQKTSERRIEDVL